MKPVGIAELKAHLSEYVHAVRGGQTVVVLDRKEPVARMVPVSHGRAALRTQRATKALRQVTLPPALAKDPGSLDALLEERRDRR